MDDLFLEDLVGIVVPSPLLAAPPRVEVTPSRIHTEQKCRKLDLY